MDIVFIVQWNMCNMDTCPDYQGVLIFQVSLCTKGLATLGPQLSLWIMQVSSFSEVSTLTPSTVIGLPGFADNLSVNFCSVPCSVIRMTF